MSFSQASTLATDVRELAERVRSELENRRERVQSETEERLQALESILADAESGRLDARMATVRLRQLRAPGSGGAPLQAGRNSIGLKIPDNAPSAFRPHDRPHLSANGSGLEITAPGNQAPVTPEGVLRRVTTKAHEQIGRLSLEDSNAHRLWLLCLLHIIKVCRSQLQSVPDDPVMRQSLHDFALEQQNVVESLAQEESRDPAMASILRAWLGNLLFSVSGEAEKASVRKVQEEIKAWQKMGANAPAPQGLNEQIISVIRKIDSSIIPACWREYLK